MIKSGKTYLEKGGKVEVTEMHHTPERQVVVLAQIQYSVEYGITKGGIPCTKLQVSLEQDGIHKQLFIVRLKYHNAVGLPASELLLMANRQATVLEIRNAILDKEDDVSYGPSGEHFIAGIAEEIHKKLQEVKYKVSE